MNNQFKTILQIADNVLALKSKRGHNYALHIWHSMFVDWCDRNHTNAELIPEPVKQELKQRDILFCDYFI